MQQQVRNIDHQIGKNSPPPPRSDELDALVRLEREDREKLKEGLPSAEEMRKRPPGAVGKHMRWDKRAKELVEPGVTRMDRWRNTKMRLNVGNDDPDLVNFEQFRPRTNSLNLDNAFIPGTNYNIPSEAFKKGWDEMNPNDEVVTLRREIEELREMVSLSLAGNKEETKEELHEEIPVGEIVVEEDEGEIVYEDPKPGPTTYTATSKCGKPFEKANERSLQRALSMHERRCNVCKTMEPQE